MIRLCSCWSRWAVWSTPSHHAMFSESFARFYTAVIYTAPCSCPRQDYRRYPKEHTFWTSTKLEKKILPSADLCTWTCWMPTKLPLRFGLIWLATILFLAIRLAVVKIASVSIKTTWMSPVVSKTILSLQQFQPGAQHETWSAHLSVHKVSKPSESWWAWISSDSHCPVSQVVAVCLRSLITTSRRGPSHCRAPSV